MSVGKFPFFTSYCLMVGVCQRSCYIWVHTLEKTPMPRWQNNCYQSTSDFPHVLMLFQKFESLRALDILLMQNFGQESTSNSSCIGVEITIKTIVKKTIELLTRIKLTYFSVVTSSWMTYVLSWISHIVGTWGLSTTYFLPKPPTQGFKSSQKKKKNCETCEDHLQNQTTNHHNMEHECASSFFHWYDFCLAIMIDILL